MFVGCQTRKGPPEGDPFEKYIVSRISCRKSDQRRPRTEASPQWRQNRRCRGRLDSHCQNRQTSMSCRRRWQAGCSWRHSRSGILPPHCSHKIRRQQWRMGRTRQIQGLCNQSKYFRRLHKRHRRRASDKSRRQPWLWRHSCRPLRLCSHCRHKPGSGRMGLRNCPQMDQRNQRGSWSKELPRGTNHPQSQGWVTARTDRCPPLG